jgi:hypothetical protein
MCNRITIALAVVAGFIGGAMSYYVLTPASVHAQTPPTSVATEIRAQKFVLVDENGTPRGAFGIETDGTVQIEVTDPKGKLWLYRNTPFKFSWTSPTVSDRPKVLTLLR